MKKFYTLLILSFLLIPTLDAQDKSFEQTFEKETGSKNKQSDKRERFHHIDVPFQPAALPAWFYNLPQDGIYAIGISDPDMEKDTAQSLALLRGKAILALMHKTRIRYIKDSYSSMRENSRDQLYTEKFDTYAKFDTKLQGDFIVVDTFITVYNEAMVLLKFLKEKKRAKEFVTINTKLLTLEFVYGNRSEYQNKYEITIDELKGKKKIENAFYNLYEVNKRYNCESIYQGVEQRAPGFFYKYERINTEDKPFYNDNGIWKDYFKELMRQIQFTAEANSFNMQESGDVFTDKSEKLYRQTGNQTFSFQLQKIEFKGDTLKMNVNGTILAN